MSALIEKVQVYADRLIVDQTELEGSFEWTLTLVPTLLRGAPAAWLHSGGPDLFAALNQQLGLKLESRTATADVRVIDSVSLPTAN